MSGYAIGCLPYSLGMDDRMMIVPQCLQCPVHPEAIGIDGGTPCDGPFYDWEQYLSGSVLYRPSMDFVPTEDAENDGLSDRDIADAPVAWQRGFVDLHRTVLRAERWCWKLPGHMLAYLVAHHPRCRFAN